MCFDKRLSWNKNIQYTNSKISRGQGILRKTREKINVQEKINKNIFNSFIKLDHSALVWGGATKSHLTKIDKSIEKSMHIML